MDYFSALNIFRSVMETGSFSASSRKLGIAVSSVARQIDALEAQLRVALFNRSTRSLTPTAAGLRYYEQTCRILDNLHEANLSVKSAADRPAGKLRVAIPVAYGERIISPLLREFCEHYPEIELDIEADEALVDIIGKKFDVAIRLGSIGDARLIAKRLSRQTRYLVASPDYLTQRSKPKLPSEITRHNCLLFSQSNKETKWFFRKNQQTENHIPKGNLHSNSSIILLEAALKGQGISLLPDWLVSQALLEGDLVRMLPEWHISRTLGSEADSVFAVYPVASRQLHKVKVFVDYMAEKLNPIHIGNTAPYFNINL